MSVFDLASDDGCLGYQLAYMISKMRMENGAADIRAIAEVLKPNIRATLSFEAEGRLGNSQYLFWDDLTLVLLDGVVALAGADDYVQSMAVPNQAGLNLDGNAGGFLAGRTIREVILTYVRPSHVPIIFAGFSMGGVHAMFAAFAMKTLNNVEDMKIITFGSPRPGGPEIAERLFALRPMRWMNALDPVPHIPPRPNQAFLWYLTLNKLQSDNAAAYVHPIGGLVLDGLGLTTRADVPEGVLPDVALNIGAWLLATQTGARSQHNLTYYVPRLSLACDRSHAEPGVPRPENHVEELPTFTPKQRREFLIQGISLIQETTRVPGFYNVGIPTQEAFVARKVGSIWTSQFRHEIISVGSRKRCRAFCAKANAFLRRLQTQSKVDIETLGSTFKQYLVDAADPEFGFKPTLSTA